MFWRNVRVIKTVGGVILSAGGIWACYQVHTTVKIVNSLLRTSCLDEQKKKVQYIYLNEPKFHPVAKPDQMTYLLPESDDESLFLTNAVFRWWTALQKSWAWRLLHIAKIGTKSERQWAVSSLANLTSLTDAEYQLLAQVCNAQTAIGLARSQESDLRFFLQPPRFFYKPLSGKELKEKMIELLQVMENKTHHSCLENFLTSYQHNSEDAPGETLAPLLEEEIISKALDVLVHHCSIGNYAKDLLFSSALPILMELHNHVQDNLKILSDIFTILSHLSQYPNTLPVFFSSGWIGILARWSRHSDVRVALPCAKALANLDPDSQEGLTYPDSIFLLHPSYRTLTPYKADIIFIHGLLGTVYITWRQRDTWKIEPPPEMTDESSRQNSSFWLDFLTKIGIEGSSKVKDTKSETPETSHLNTQQFIDEMIDMQNEDSDVVENDYDFILADLPEAAQRSHSGVYSFSGGQENLRSIAEKSEHSTCWARDWLPKDCPHVRVLGLSYPTSLSQWFPICPHKQSRLRMAERSIEFMQKLQQVGVGDRPIIWVAHSMGGLLVKQMLVTAYESGDKKLENIFRNTKAIVFFSCPHMGSEIADLRVHTEMLIWPSFEVQELRYRSAALTSLHLRFMQALQASTMRILSFTETKPTNVTAIRLPLSFVRPQSADPGVGEFYEIPLDHVDICKPNGRLSFLYRKVVDTINTVLTGR